MQTKFENLEELQGMVNDLDTAKLAKVTVHPDQENSYSPEGYVSIWNVSRNLMETIVERRNSTLIQHKDAYGCFINAAKQRGIEVSGMVKNHGGTVIVESTFDNIKVEDGSEAGINVGLRMVNDYNSNRGPSFKAEGFGIRSVCSNGMIMTDIVSHAFRKHTKTAEIEKAMIELIDNVVKSLDKIKAIIDAARKDIFETYDDMRETVLGEMRSKKKANSIIDLLEEIENVSRYTVYNAITNYATHQANDEKSRVRLHRIAQKVLIQEKDELERKSWEKV